MCNIRGDVKPWFTERASRRVVLKATAALGAMVAAPALVRPVAGHAQDAPPPVTRADYFSEVLDGSFTTAAEARIFSTSFQFTAIAPHWAGTASPGAYVVLELGTDGETWSDPITVDVSPDASAERDRDGRYFGVLVAADDASWVRYRSYASDGTPQQLPDLVFTYIDSSDGPLASELVSPAADPNLDPPVIISRAAWGCDEKLRYVDQDTTKDVIWELEYKTVEHVIIHHTATPNFRDPMVEIRSIYYYHAITRDWGDIGYNYLVDFHGNVYEGRIGGENVIAGHATSYNDGTCGVSVMGDFTSVDVTPEAQTGLIWIVAWAGRKLDPLGSADFTTRTGDIDEDLPTICGHRNVQQTTCPGDSLYSDIPFIREAVNSVLLGEEDPGGTTEFNVGDAVKVNTSGANLRSGPGTSFSSVTTLALNAKATIQDGPVTNGGYTWYQIKAGSQTGWIASMLIDDDITVPPTAKFQINDQVQTNSANVNLRSAASTNASILASLPTGTIGKVLAGPKDATGFTWYQVQTTAGTGWIVQDYLQKQTKPAGAFANGEKVEVNTDVLSLRSSAGVNKPVIASMPQGTKLTITYAYNKADGYEWYKVTGSYGVGWVAGSFLKRQTTAGAFAKGDRVMVSTDVLSLRSSAGTTKPVVASMPEGTRLTITYAYNRVDGYEWYKVTGSYGDGWVAGAFISKDNGSSTGGLQIKVGFTVYVSDGPVNLRTSASTSGAIVATANTNAKFKVIDGPRTANGYTWWRVQSASVGTGWVVADFIERR